MTIRDRADRHEPTLRPVRWPPWHGAGLRRLALIAVVLVLAAGLLHLWEPRPGETAGSCAGPPSGDRSPVAGPPPPSPSSGPRPSAGATGATSSAPAGRMPLPTGTVGLPVRLAEPAALAVVQPGTQVDLLAMTGGGSGPAGSEPLLVAAGALVLGLVNTVAEGEVTALYLALRPEQARQAIGLPDDARFAIVVRSEGR